MAARDNEIKWSFENFLKRVDDFNFTIDISRTGQMQLSKVKGSLIYHNEYYNAIKFF
jgi:hypothetical protein